MSEKCKNCFKEIPTEMERVDGVHMSCEDAYFKSNRVFYRIKLEGERAIIEQSVDEWLANLGLEESMTITKIFMTQAEFDDLPEQDL